MKKVLIIEDDTLISDLQRDYLEASDFQVTTESDGERGLKLALNNTYNLIVLDVMLPNKTGFEICKEIQKVKQIPIIFVTAKKEEIDTIRGLSLGAVDYLVKPFSPAVLVARVKSHIANYDRLTGENKKIPDNEITIGNMRIIPKSRRVFIASKEISLAHKEYEILYLMATNPDTVFSREKLFDRIWGEDTYGDIATVTVHINRLREKIEIDSSNPIFIQTVWGAGYRFSIPL